MQSSRKYLLVAALATSTALTGCFLGSESSGPSSEEVKKSDEAALVASGKLEATVANMQDIEQFSYGKEDLSDLKASRAQFEEAARLNPGNNKAQLGMALTGILLAAQSTRLSTLINQTLEAKSPFDSRLPEQAPLMRGEVLRKVAQASTLPEFHLIQDAVADTMLPALDEAIINLTRVYQDPAFSMKLFIEGDSLELDHAEAGVLLAGVHAIHGLLTLYLAYDIDIDHEGSYDYLEALTGIGDIENFEDLTLEQRAALNKAAVILGPTSPFLAVRPAWKARLANVDDEMKRALDILKESAASLATETDPQANDLIHLCAPLEFGGCINTEDWQEGKDAIDTARKYMDQPYVFQLPAIDTTVKVNFAAYFNVQDYKKMLPHYGFYNANEWSEEKPVLYFTDASGRITGNIKTLIQIGKDAEELGTPAAEVVAQLKAVIHFQDPTFQNYLPGATQADIWNLILKQAVENEGSDLKPADGLPKRAISTMGPNFALSLIGK
jgi:hypothetical protein